MNKKLLSDKLCVLCGKNFATTKDHVPPQSIFNAPRPNNLISVPACKACNNGASILDEKFKTYLGMHVAQFSKQGETLFKQAIRTVRHNRKLRQEIINKLEPLHISQSEGEIVDKQHSVLWDSDAHDKVIERIVRGLFYHHYQSILGDEADITVYWFKEPPEEFKEMSLHKESVGNNAFIYQHNKIDNSEYDSIWLFQFYESHWAAGITYSKSTNN